jgi:hypothetical protein
MKKHIVALLSLFLLFSSCIKKEDIIPNPLDNGNSESLAKDFLSADNYDKVTIEIQYVNGYQPSAETIESLKAFLSQHLNKPGGITVAQNAVVSLQKEQLTMVQLQAIEQHNRTQYSADKKIAAYIFFADASFAEDTDDKKVLGMAYGNSSIVVFEKTIKSLSGGFGQPSVSTVEETVTRHEFAHLLGLVNNGSTMQSDHLDKDNGKHCNNPDCLMYYATETNDLIGNLLGKSAPDLDAACANDLRANGGK